MSAEIRWSLTNPVSHPVPASPRAVRRGPCDAVAFPSVKRAMLETCGSAGEGHEEGAPSRMIE
jgi:hypothetical protein